MSITAAVERPALPSQQALGRYHIERPLGHGPRGPSYMGRSDDSSDPVVIKVLTCPEARDADWLEPDQCFVASNVTFELLTKELTFASTAELIAGLRNPSVDFGHQARVDIHARMVRPFLDVTLLLLGLPLVMTRENFRGLTVQDTLVTYLADPN